MGWSGRRRSSTTRMKHRRAHPPTHCAMCGRSDVRLEQDHTTNLAVRPDLDVVANLQWLCVPCHEVKTRRERMVGIAAHHQRRREQRTRPSEQHPGLLA